MSHEFYVGLMTGTSVDAIDAALCRFKNQENNDDGAEHNHPKGPHFELVDAISLELQAETQNGIKQLFVPGNNEIDQLGWLDVELANEYANAVIALLNRNALDYTQISAIGCHGQTVRHRPERATSKTAFSLQIGDPNTLAARTGITVIADFRRKDIALGGQGAPLAPAFHQFISRDIAKPIAFLNIGGIANLTLLNQPNAEVIGFDSGPGNALLDYWVHKHQGKPYDDQGQWASSGAIDAKLLDTLMNHPFLDMAPPKSTGREEFSTQWLDTVLVEVYGAELTVPPENVQATLLEFTASAIVNSIKQHGEQAAIFVCGGGFRNDFLIQRLRAQLPHTKILSTETLGVHPDWVEACAFAWLAHQRMHQLPGNIPSVTGAQHPGVLGGVWLP